MKIRKEFLVFGGVVLVLIGCLIFSKTKSSKPKYDASKIVINYEASEEVEDSIEEAEGFEDEFENFDYYEEETEVDDSLTLDDTSSIDSSFDDEIVDDEVVESESETETGIVESAEEINVEFTSDIVAEIFYSFANNIEVDSNLVTDNLINTFDTSVYNKYDIVGVAVDNDSTYDDGYRTVIADMPDDSYLFKLSFTFSEDGKLDTLIWEEL